MWCVDVELFVFEGIARYFTMRCCIKTNVMKMSRKKVKDINQTCNIYRATCSCLNELDKILIQDANIDLCFVLDVADVEEGTGGHGDLCHQFLPAKNLTKTLTKREECCSPTTICVVSPSSTPRNLQVLWRR